MKACQAFGSYGFSALLLLGSLGMPSAHAADNKTFPGSFCQSDGSQQTLYYSGVEGMTIANRTNQARSAVCPIVRDNTTQAWLRLRVTVRDRHSTQDVRCVAHSTPPDGSGGWAQTQTTVGEGFATLNYGAIGAAPGGVYSVVCQLPAMEKVNQPSYVASYELIEP
jgi:hypothetical protein